MVGVILITPTAKQSNTATDDKEKLVDGDTIIDVVAIKEGLEDPTLITTSVRQRREPPSGLLICVSAVLLLVCISIGSWLFYDFYNRAPRTWHRTCKYRLKSTQLDDGGIFFDHGGLVAFDDGNNHLISNFVKQGSENNYEFNPTKKDIPEEFQQDVKIDVKNNLELIDVPQLGISNHIRVVHDFQHNTTAIRDFDVEKCFVLPLDREHVPNPANFIETFLMKMPGSYLPDNEIIRRTMKIQMPSLTRKEVRDAYGSVISEECNGVKVYRLVKKPAEEEKIVVRRSRSIKHFYVFSAGKKAFAIDVD
ncbi:unnamed protein product [Didymodactylos carnosus]|uniref:Integral membrane protein 2 n=1 Tax=Didymodactylos carnosus TaxID=1234261 RepID=A0A815JNW8_9BILA|nr:unnamed protein product [Didymodactylos carnosus]CAF1382512.1 unnamed protein product [Didymodactylos carnosus]CAF4036867.1 unnamed protein product [Didymodactylos carnosus]CAF4277704.1 unnamed protein product [Didymodactylos carnosus]